MAKNQYGYGPTRNLAQRALLNEVESRDLVDSGGGAEATLIRDALSDWYDANDPGGEKSYLMSHISGIFTTYTDEQILELFAALFNFMYVIHDKWGDFSALPSSWALTEPMAVTPATTPGALTGTVVRTQRQKLYNWLMDLQIPGLGSVKAVAEP